jgi:phage terminase small subunit
VDGLALTMKQELFCVEYAKTGNARQAYKKAGYACKNDEVVDAAASRLLSQVKVKERLAELTEEAKNNAIADIQEMQEKLTAIIRQELTEEVIVSDQIAGVQRLTKTSSIKDVISAIEKLGKMQGAFVDRMNLDGALQVVFEGEDEIAD